MLNHNFQYCITVVSICTAASPHPFRCGAAASFSLHPPLLLTSSSPLLQEPIQQGRGSSPIRDVGQMHIVSVHDPCTSHFIQCHFVSRSCQCPPVDYVNVIPTLCYSVLCLSVYVTSDTIKQPDVFLSHVIFAASVDEPREHCDVHDLDLIPNHSFYVN
jgi:hypothetical protein